MAKEFTIRTFKEGNFKDDRGNTWCDMVLEENPSEPVRIVVKDPTKFSDGMKIYGEIKLQKSQAGREYYRFYREQKPETQEARGSTFDSSGAKHGNALKIAADFYLTQGVREMNEDQFVDAVQSLAKRIFDIPVPGAAVGTTETKKQFVNSTNSPSGDGATDAYNSADMQSLASTYGDTIAPVPDGEINLDDIPF